MKFKKGLSGVLCFLTLLYTVLPISLQLKNSPSIPRGIPVHLLINQKLLKGERCFTLIQEISSVQETYNACYTEFLKKIFSNIKKAVNIKAKYLLESLKFQK